MVVGDVLGGIALMLPQIPTAVVLQPPVFHPAALVEVRIGIRVQFGEAHDCGFLKKNRAVSHGQGALHTAQLP